MTAPAARALAALDESPYDLIFIDWAVILTSPAGVHAEPGPPAAAPR
ncbi:hypothetical protein [Frankia sp. AgKG'84/4]|nr:hypothetical protein [Frankia sp. AgKG'84/4]